MKKFNEWKDESTVNENPDILIEKITELTELMEQALKSFQGERFEGFLSLIGNVHNMKRTLVEIEHDVQSPGFLTSEEKETKMKKIPYKEKKSKGTRMVTDNEIGKDYKGHLEKNGTVEPFRVMTKKS